MNCGEVKEIIQLYMDSELEARDTLAVQRHLESCPSCSSLLSAFAEQDRALRQAAHAEASDNRALRESILARIREHSPQPVSRWRSPAILRRAAALAALAIAATLLILFGQTPVTDEVYAAVAADHAAHCTLDKLDNAFKDGDTLNRLVAEYGRMKATPDLSAFGFSDPHAKICTVNGRKFLHLICLDSNGQGLSLFIRPHAADLGVERLTVLDQKGFSVASLSRSGVDVLVVSSLDEERTSKIAEAVAAQL
ncbi:MAG: zf-HC2 domain-containing protein [Blastocatellia bacterium]|nr:zf-HC2 domain-containing protein [Blastocatellia bacterium]